MVAALLRVVHGGAQDARLLPTKGNPRPDFFVKAFVRAGRFTTQFVRLDFDTRPIFGSTATLTLPRKGQLISRLYLVTTMPDIATPQLAAREWCRANGKAFVGPSFGWTNSLGHALVTAASIQIGGTTVENLDGRLMEVMDEFYTPLEKVPLMDRLLKRDSSSFQPGASFGRDTITTAVTPLPFWFSCGDTGAFLPIDAIQADLVRLSVTFAQRAALYTSTAQVPLDPAVAANPAGGEAYASLVGSPFYYADPVAGKLVAGLRGNPSQATQVSPVPGVNMSPDAALVLGETYVMAEYIYLDRPEANRFRLADIQIPVVQHYTFDPVATGASATTNVYLKVPNPTRNLFFYAQRVEAPAWNAPFLATRDLSGGGAADPAGLTPWWPNASVLGPRVYSEIVPAFQFRPSEPLASVALVYEGKLWRWATDSPALFRSILPSMEMRKAPWVNRYYYTLPFGLGSGITNPSQPSGEANLDKMVNINLRLEMKPLAGYLDPNAVPAMRIYCWAETYNVLRVYGGRAGMMFGY